MSANPQLMAAARPHVLLTALQPMAAGVAYFGAGKLGALLAIAPSYSIAFAPAAGVAVVAVWLAGPASLIGIGAGAALLAIEGAERRTPATYGFAAGLALAAMLQAYAVLVLTRRCLSVQHPLDSGPAVARFLLLITPLSCLVDALLGTAVSCAAGMSPASEWLTSAIVWWSRDVLGVVVVAPIVFPFAARPRAIWRRRRLSVALPIALLVAVAIVAFVRTSRLEQRRVEHNFSERALWLERAWTVRIESFVQTLQSLRDLFISSNQVERREFGAFASGPLQRRPGLQALIWLPRVAAIDRPAVEAQARREGLVDFSIRSLPGEALPPTAPDSFPVYFAEPDSFDRRAFGIDAASESRRRNVLVRARDSGEPTASEAISAFSVPRGLPTIMLALAVYRSDVPIDTVAARRVAHRGFVVAVIRMDDLVNAAIGSAGERDITASVFDVSDPKKPTSLHAEPIPETRFDPLQWRFPIEVGGRRWVLQLSATSAYTQAENSWEARAMLTGALVFCGILAGLLLTLTGRAVVLERTSRDTAQLLSTLVQSSHDAILAYDENGSLVGWNAGAARSFGWEADEALGKGADLFVPTELLSEQRAKMQRALAGESQETFESVRVDKTGARREYEIKLSPIRGAAGEVRGASEICRDVSLAKARDRELRASLSEKEILLKEVHHRVKNNLQVISSLLRLQASYLSTGELQKQFGESQARVQSIALVHEQLYRSSDLAHIDFDSYVRMLAAGVFQGQSHIGQPIGYTVEGNEIQLDVDTAVPSGLIINELLTNALKHAFTDGRSGGIAVRLARLPDGRLELCVADDGVGLPIGLDPANTNSLGLELVYALADQLGAEVTVDRSAGTNFRFRFAAVSG